MNNLLLSILSAVSVAVTPFAAVVLANGDCAPYSVTIVSDTSNTVVLGGSPAVSVTPHAAWTATIPGSTTWIWETGPTGVNEIVGFEKTFDVIGTPLGGVLDIASDNSYEAYINGVLLFADAAADNFKLATQDTHVVLSGDLLSGTNTLRVEVKNHGSFNAATNPAGLLYKLSVDSEQCDDDIKVINKNSAYIKNIVSSKADTGDNTAGGSAGGTGGSGGSVTNNGSGNDVNGNATGNGGNGGAAGIGGAVISGDAISTALAATYANLNDTEVDSCECGGSGDTIVLNKNRVKTKNIVRSHGDTGNNTADGSTGGNGGAGGAVANNGSSNDANGNTTGNGGTGGSGSDELGGFVQTGNAVSIASVLNKLNRNITRILR